jgi:hypothetical protein
LCRHLQGFVYVAFVIDTFARRFVGWRASRTAHAGFVLHALEQALHERRPVRGGGLVHHCDRGVQYVAIKYTERLAEAGVESSVGSVGDSYNNALAETINGLYKAEVIWRRGPWRNFEAVEFATLEWVDWFNHRRLLEPIGNIPPAEAERATMRNARSPPWRRDSNQMASGNPGAVQNAFAALDTPGCDRGRAALRFGGAFDSRFWSAEQSGCKQSSTASHLISANGSTGSCRLASTSSWLAKQDRQAMLL